MPETMRRILERYIGENGVRFPQYVIAILDRRHCAVGIQGPVLGSIDDAIWLPALRYMAVRSHDATGQRQFIRHPRFLQAPHRTLSAAGRRPSPNFDHG